jgi:alpha-glucosidase
MQKKNVPGFAMTRRNVLGGMAASVTAGLFSPSFLEASDPLFGTPARDPKGPDTANHATMATPITLESPSGNVAITLCFSGSRFVYSVFFQGREVIHPSALGLALEGAAGLDSHFRLTKTIRMERRTSWKPLFGERAEVPDHFNAIEIELEEDIPPRRTLGIEVRAYDEGVAFRYRVPEQRGVLSLTVGDELTEFRLPVGAHGWETQTAQGFYRRVLVEEMLGASERPLLLELPGGPWMAIAEAAVEDYPSMFLISLHAERHSLGGKLMAPAHCRIPFESPWRVVLIAEKPGKLLEHNYLFQNLSPASRLGATDWIHPGKVLRETTLSTRGGREAVDFAARQNIQYIAYDAGWYGDEADEGSDATKVKVDPQRLNSDPAYQGLDLRQVINHGKSKGVGVILYVNRQALERQLDSILPLYAEWGVAGIKYGFVNVHTQPWTRWLYDAVRKAAEHRLILDVHDEFRPTGMSRTYPNLLTQEGIRGNEEFPDATQNTILPFTRMLVGAADYTFCWLDPRLKNTWGHQMALAVVLYSPLQFVYWYDRPISFTAECSGMEWFRDLPTVWDDTKVLDGSPGEFAAVARRKGTSWFLGIANNNSGREMKLALEMLEPGREYAASIFADGDGPRDVRRTQKSFRRGDVLELTLHPRGGAAVRFTQNNGS